MLPSRVLFSRAAAHVAPNLVRSARVNAKRSMMTSVPPEVASIGRLNHVAVAVNDLDGAEVSGEVDLPEHGVTTVFVDLGNTKIELLRPLGEQSPIAAFLEKNTHGGIHHICVEVPDIEVAVRAAESNGMKVLGKPRLGAHGLPVVFVHPKSAYGVLVEFEEVKK